MSTAAITTTSFSPLLATKLMPPRRGRGTLPRPRLEQLIERIAECSLTVLKAPPGFGKSTLASAWAESALARGAHVAWLTLDEADDSPERLLLYAAAAIQRGFDSDEDASPLKDLSLIPAEHLATLLLNDLERRQQHCYLFIDDYHCVTADNLIAAFDGLIRYAPDNLHLVFCGRSDLPSTLFAHTYSDALLEVDASELRFDLDETRDLTLRAGLDALEPTELLDLHQATEGWIAALRASLLNLRQRPVGGPRLAKSITGLLDELLGRLPQELATRLTTLAALDKFNPALAEHLTGDSDGQALIAELERLQLFITGLDQSDEWFSLHPLFREHLRRRLAPSELNHLRRMAADWFATHQAWMDAVRSALAAGDTDSALQWIANCAMGMVERGDFIILLDWQRQLQDRLLQCPMELKLALAWAAGLGMSGENARQLLTEVHTELDALGRSGEQDPLYWECRAMEAMALAIEDHPEAGGQLATACLPHLIERPWVYNTLLNVICFSHLHASRWEAFYSVPPILKEPLEHRRYLFNQVYRLTLMGLGEMLQGRFSQAAAIFEEGLRLANEQSHGHPVLRALPSGFLAALRYQQGRLDDAAQLAFEHLEIVKLGGYLDCVAGLLLTTNRLSSRRTAQQGVRHLLEDGERLAQIRHWPRLQAHLLMERTRVSLLEHKGAEALACAQQLENLLEQQSIEAPEEAGHFRFMACQAALWCEAAGLPRSADLQQVEQVCSHALQDNRRLMLINLVAGLAQVHWQRKQPDTAVACLLDAVQLVESSGARQMLADLPEREILLQVANHALQRRLSQQQQAQLQRLLPDGQGSIEPPTLAQPTIALTSKERHVLELVAQGKSNKEMAKLLGIAPETIKSHMKNIFTKLQVDSRAQAAVAAKAAGLI